MDIHEYTLWEVRYSGSLQDIANILEYPQEQVLFSGIISDTESCIILGSRTKIIYLPSPKLPN